MDRSDYYKHYQDNIKLLECEIAQVKKAAQTAIGKKAWQEKKGYCISQIAATDTEIKACTRLYTFLICSWFEARLMKMLYENSSVAFTDTEIENIRSLSSMDEKWRTSFSIAVCRSYGFPYSGDIDYSSQFNSSSLQLSNYASVRALFVDIKDAITIRNRLAHGQWETQFNAKNTNVSQYDFLKNYDNIQKLDILKQCFNHIGDIINLYVTCKNKQSSDFDQQIKKKIDLILQKKTRLQNSDYQKYVNQLSKCYEGNRNRSVSSSTVQ